MKLFYILLIPILFTVACNEVEKENAADHENEQTQDLSKELTSSEKLSKRWVLVKRTNTKRDKIIEFDENNSSVITFFEDNGYFRVYDSLSDLDKEHGVKKIEQRHSGQWEIVEDQLILRYTKTDTVIVEKLSVEKLNEDEMILKNSEKDQIDQYNVKFE